MARVRLSTKGQLIIPKAIREPRGWGEGTELELEEEGDRVVLRAVRPLTTTVDDLLGCLPYRGPPKTLAQMEAGIARGARARKSR